MSVHRSILLIPLLIVLLSSCMTLDGSNSYRKKNKCCGLIKCDIHRRSQQRKHKMATHAHRSLRKKEQRIKRGY